MRSSMKGVYAIQITRIAQGLKCFSFFMSKLGMAPLLPLSKDATKEEKEERKRIKEERIAKMKEFAAKIGQPLPADTDEDRAEEAWTEAGVPTELSEIDDHVIPDVDTGTQEKKSTDMFKLMIADYNGICDWLAKNKGKIETAIPKASIGIISDESEMAMMESYNYLVRSEAVLKKSLEKMVSKHPLWTEFLVHVKGCGKLLSSVMIAEYDLSRADHVSSFMKYTGLDAVQKVDEHGIPQFHEDGTPIMEGRSRKKEHLQMVEYVNKKGEKETKLGITYNDFLKTKVVGVLAGCLIRSLEDKKTKLKNYYGRIYDDYKVRNLNDPRKKDLKPKHREAQCRRYMIKIFIEDLYYAWCMIEGRSLEMNYAEDKLGIRHHGPRHPALEALAQKHGVDLRKLKSHMHPMG